MKTSTPVAGFHDRPAGLRDGNKGDESAGEIGPIVESAVSVDDARVIGPGSGISDGILEAPVCIFWITGLVSVAEEGVCVPVCVGEPCGGVRAVGDSNPNAS